MKNIKTILGAQLTSILLATALSTYGTAASEVPFKGSLQGPFIITPLTPPEAHVLIEGTGNATHLGRFTVEIPHLVSFATFTGSGTYVFTAANGDTLTADFTGVATPTGNPDELAIVENAIVTGGTGRFQGATGSFTVVRLAQLAGPTAGVTTGSFSGSIVFSKAKKN